MELTLGVNRFDPEIDEKPHRQDFRVRVRLDQKVLDALLEAGRMDSTLSFRRSCRSAICGSCAVSINGTVALACHTSIGDVLSEDGRIDVDPLPRFRQIKDLVVDLDPLFESLKAVVPWVIPRAGDDGRVFPEDAAVVQTGAACILCGICDAAMTPDTDVKPAALVKGCRLAVDPRDRLGMARMALMNVPGDVLRLFLRDLPDACPKGIRLAEFVLPSSK